jgi:hypothetical protein
VVLALVVLTPLVVGVHQERVVVVMHVVMAAMFGFAEDTARVVVRDVVMVVCVDDAGMGVFMLDIADNARHRLRLSHRDTSR